MDSRYWELLWNTVQMAATGLILGNILGALFALACCLHQRVAALLWPIGMALFVTPLVILAPIVGAVWGDAVGGIILSTLCVFFPSAAMLLATANSVSSKWLDMTRAFGATTIRALGIVALPTALPALLAALKTTAPAAVLGAVTAGLFGNQNLGSWLVTAMTVGPPRDLVVICCSCAGMAWFAQMAIGFAERGPLSHRKAATLLAFDPSRMMAPRERVTHWGMTLLAAGLVLVLWQLVVQMID